MWEKTKCASLSFFIMTIIISTSARSRVKGTTPEATTGAWLCVKFVLFARFDGHKLQRKHAEVSAVAMTRGGEIALRHGPEHLFDTRHHNSE